MSLWGKPVFVPRFPQVEAFTSAQSGVTYTNGIGGLSLNDLRKIARAISKNANITPATSAVWVSVYNRKISLGDGGQFNIDGTDRGFAIKSFNHYDLTNPNEYGMPTATGKAGLVFDQSLVLLSAQYGTSQTDGSGWATVNMRSAVGAYASQLPAIAVNLPCATSASDSTIQTVSDKVFLPSLKEITNSAGNAVGGANEGTQWGWYKYNTGTGNRQKYNASGNARAWAMRSVRHYDSTREDYVAISGGGSTTYYQRGQTANFTLAFCM